MWIYTNFANFIYVLLEQEIGVAARLEARLLNADFHGRQTFLDLEGDECNTRTIYFHPPLPFGFALLS